MTIGFLEFCAILVIVGAVTKVLIEGMRHGALTNNPWGPHRALSAEELKQLREVLQRQDATMRQLQERLENLEAVVAGKEFQAAQRVAKALDEGRMPEYPARPQPAPAMTKAGE